MAENLLPEHGFKDGLYYDEDNNTEGYELSARDIVNIITPMFVVSPPSNINFQQVNDTTDKWTMTTVIDGQTYLKEYTITISGRGTEDEEVQSMTLPTGHVITFTNS